jgi:hypothetical protein
LHIAQESNYMWAIYAALFNHAMLSIEVTQAVLFSRRNLILSWQMFNGISKSVKYIQLDKLQRRRQ